MILTKMHWSHKLLSAAGAVFESRRIAWPSPVCLAGLVMCPEFLFGGNYSRTASKMEWEKSLCQALCMRRCRQCGEAEQRAGGRQVTRENPVMVLAGRGEAA